MKKIFALLLAAMMLLSLVACGNDTAKEPENTTEATTEATTTEATTTEATTTTTEPTTTEATTTTPAPDPLVYIESLFTKVDITNENKKELQITNEAVENEAEAAIWDEDGEGVLVNGVTLVSFNLPKDIPVDTTVVFHIKGTSDDNFRLWLLDSGVVTSSNQFNATNDEGYFKGEYEFFVELTCQYFDADIADNLAKQIAFKAASWNTTLTNLKIDECQFFEGTLEEYRTAMEAALESGEVPAEGAEVVTEAPADEADAPAEE